MHKGAAIAVTLNDRLDYFGQTVNIAARVENLAGGDEICVTEDVHDAPGVADIFAPFVSRRTETELKGVDQPTPVCYLLRNRNKPMIIKLSTNPNRNQNIFCLQAHADAFL
jgi:class 3 adenylate cyclase